MSTYFWIDFSRYGLSEKARRSASYVEIQDFSQRMKRIARALQRA
ncbi:hypothetical protein HMPREF1581_01518, partial [Gardnerella vaginalis JCP8108]